MRVDLYSWKNFIVVKVAGLVLILFGAYIIGQQVVLPLRQINSSNNFDENSVSWGNYEIRIEGSNQTEDNPWGFTAGIIDMESIGDCVLLTPNTSLVLENISSKEVIFIELTIHPWVKELSDGAGILVRFKDIEENVIGEDDIHIGNEESWITLEYNMEQFPNINSIELLCNNGLLDDDTADWVVIKETNFQEKMDNNS